MKQDTLQKTYNSLNEKFGFVGDEFKSERSKLLRGLRKVAKAYGCPKRNGQAAEAPFIWVTHKGKKLLPAQMATPHLFNALRMIWNNSVEHYYKIPGVNVWGDVKHWSKSYRKQALDELQTELESRDYHAELDSEQLDHYAYMQVATEAAKAAGSYAS